MKRTHSSRSRNLFVLLLCLMLLLASCSSGKDASYDSSSAYSYKKDAEEYGFSLYSDEAVSEAEMPSSPSDSPESALSGYEKLEQKLIYTGFLTVETLEFDQTCSGVEEMVRQFGGFTESSNRSGRTVYRGEEGTPTLVDRYANYTLRIPQGRFAEFMDRAGDLGNVTDVSTQLDNISPQYYDTQSRLDAYQIQYDRLLSLLEKADRMEDILALETQLTEVRYQLESLTTQLRGWQSQVDYSTVNLSIREVTRYTPPEKQSYPERLVKAVSGSLSRFTELIGNFFIDFIYWIPWLIILYAVYRLIRRFHPKNHLPKRKMRKKKNAPLPAEDDSQPISAEAEREQPTGGSSEPLPAEDGNAPLPPTDQ